MAQLTNPQLVAAWHEAVEALREDGANGETVRRGLLPALDASPDGWGEV